MGRSPTELVLRFNTDPHSAQAAFLKRAMTTLEHIAAHMPVQALNDALAAPTGAGSLAQVLSEFDLLTEPLSNLDPLASAQARNIAHREEVTKLAGGLLSAEDVGRILGISRQAVDKRRRNDALLAMRQGNDWKYPRCQFNDGESVTGLGAVIAAFKDQGPWVTLDFLVSSDTALEGLSPIEALITGKVSEVERLTRASTGDGFS